MAEKRRYPGSMEGSALGSHGGTDFSLDDDDGKKRRRRIPRTRRASLASEYSQVEQEAEEARLLKEIPVEFDQLEDYEDIALLTEIPEATKQRIRQSLMQQLGKLEFPAPRSNWESAILELIEPQIHILIEAELRRMRTAVQEQVNVDTFQKYAEQIAAQITPLLEERIRQDVLEEYEDLMRQREADANEQN